MADGHTAIDPLSSLPIPPLAFSGDLTLPDDFISFDTDDFDITFDDIHLPSDTEEFFNSAFNSSNPFDLSSSDHEFHDFVSDYDTGGGSGGSGGHDSDVSGFLNIPSPESEIDKSGKCFVDESVLNFENSDENLENLSPENDNRSGKCFVDETVMNLDNLSPENDTDASGKCFVDETVMNLENLERIDNPASSQGSGNCGSDGSEAGTNCGSPESGNSVVDQKVKRELGSNFVLKRKQESSDGNSVKYRRSNEASATTTTTENYSNSNQTDEKDEKKKARLIRNRESAQLSRQRKKHYVEELEDKVRAMHSTIQDLNARITYFAAENATLKQQMVAGVGGVNGVGGAGGAGMCSPHVMYPPHPAMAPMGYPWMPCPPYVVKSQGSQVPLVPIPRLKPQQPASSQKSKKVDVKKPEGTTTSNTNTKTKTKTKTKKVASISFLGLLLFIALFGGLVPFMNVTVTDGGYGYGNSGVSSDYKFYNQQHSGKVLIGDEHINGTGGIAREPNASEPLVASLYVPRNDKLVKIDGNLIIHSVLASEKAMASREEEETTKKEDSGLAVAFDLVPAISVPAVGRNGGRQPHMYRTSSDRQRVLSSDKENLKSKHADGKLQQWFREGLAGPMLSSGMCTEVFQFDVSAASSPGAIIPATSAINITTANNNSTYLTTMKNRRILHNLPIPFSPATTNITKEQVKNSKHETNLKNNSVSSMVVSVLFDPREAADGGDVEGMMGGSKSFSRIFVVVLLDSVKYVTYSCMLPLKGASHLVTA